MNKRIIIFIVAYLCTASTVYADDLSIGISSWYADWKMVEDNNTTSNIDPVLYIGPSVAYQFSEKWSTTLVALATPKKYTWGDNGEQNKLRRYDIDAALNYQLNRYCKIFGGAKYLAFTYDDEANNVEGIHHAAGPGAGIGLTVPVISNVYLLCNISGLFIYGNENHEDPTGKMSMDFYETGINGLLQGAYYIPSVAITLAFGYRYQYMITRYSKTDEGFQNLEHTFKGITFLLVKSFSL